MTDKRGASHILLMYEGSMRSTATRSREEALTKIQALKGELDTGGDFTELATRYSDCPSGQQDGRFGTFGQGQMVPAFETAAFGLDIGEVSGIVETPFGFHLVHRTDYAERVMLSLGTHDEKLRLLDLPFLNLDGYSPSNA